MLERPEVPGRRSPFAAAFLSFLFPGLGQAYAGLFGRALGFAALPLLSIALLAGLLVNRPTRNALLPEFTSPTVLLIVLALNIGLLVYRAIAIVDAYRAAMARNRSVEQRLPAPQRTHALVRLVSVAGLLAVLLVMGVGHAAAARVNLAFYDLITGITSLGVEDPAPVAPTQRPRQTAAPGAATQAPTMAPATPEPTVPPPQWTGTERLNILLIGSDRRPEIEDHYFTDTLIVASIDPVTKQLAMFSLPRDTTNVPLPADWPAHSFFGGSYPDKINTLWLRAQRSPTLFPGSTSQRGYVALKGALGELYQLDIQYYVEVDLAGFRQMIDTLGGVVINVQVPVSDDHYPTDDGRGALNLYIPPGIQHMDGAQALAYARARHKTNDFDRADRQQRVLVSLRQQTDLLSVLLPGRLEPLVAATKRTIHTDIPGDLLPRLVSLGQGVNLADRRSIVFTPPIFQQECLECYSLSPYVDRIRSAVRQAFQFDPALDAARKQLAREAAKVSVQNGSGISGQATRIADYLAYLGVDANVPPANNGRADRLDYSNTVITVYNGAGERLKNTLRILQEQFGGTVTEETDPTVTADIVLVTGRATPDLRAPE